MGLPALAAVVVAALVLGYRFYGRYVARQFALDDRTVTPAHKKADGVDFVPTKPFYLLGQHFSAIAAAGPIVGPIAACMAFGWLPCVLWIGLGVIFIGAVHDFSALVASVRHKAQSVAGIVRENLGKRAWLAILAFIWIALVYVIVAFADVTAGTFAGLVEELGANGTVLGILEDVELADRSARLAPGDALVLYTDGLTECNAPEVWTPARLDSAIAGARRMSAQGIVEHLAAQTPGTLRDDMALLALRVQPLL